MKNIILIVTFLIFLTQVIIAQDQLEVSKDSLFINGKLGLMGRWQTGNLNQISLMPNGTISLKNKSYFLALNGTYHFLKVGGFQAINDLWTNGLYQNQSNRKFFLSIHTIMGFAKSYKINHSIVIGLGAGVNIHKKSRTNYLQIHLYGDFLNFQYDEKKSHEAFAIGSLIRGVFPINNQISLRWELASFHSTKNKSFWGGSNNFQLNFSLRKNLMININHRTQYNNQTVASIHNVNTEMLFGIQYQFSNN